MRRVLSPILLALLAACGGDPATAPAEPPPPPVAAAPDTPALAAAREKMIEEQVLPMGVADAAVLRALRTVPRHAFVPASLAPEAYADRALRRPDGEVLPAPGLTAATLAVLDLAPDARILECGTRTGWLTALLATVARDGRVVTVDARPRVQARARGVLAGLGIGNVEYVVADPLAAPAGGPFDAIVVNGVVPHLPKALYAALVPGGRLLAPVGEPAEPQTLILTVRGTETPRETRPILSVRFGPLPRVP